MRRSKGDQEPEGAIKYLAPDTMGYIEAWLAAAGLSRGPLFRPLTKGGRVGATALIKRHAELDPWRDPKLDPFGVMLLMG